MTDTARRLRELAPRQQSIEDSRTLERAAEDIEKLLKVLRVTRAYLEHARLDSSSPRNSYIEGKNGDNDDL